MQMFLKKTCIFADEMNTVMKKGHFVIRIVMMTFGLIGGVSLLASAQVDDLRRVSDKVGLSTIYQQRKPAETVKPQGHGLSMDTATFYRHRLYAPGDYGSANWRIPALCALPDGSLLAVNDKRKFNEGDSFGIIDPTC